MSPTGKPTKSPSSQPLVLALSTPSFRATGLTSALTSPAPEKSATRKSIPSVKSRGSGLSSASSAARTSKPS